MIGFPRRAQRSVTIVEQRSAQFACQRLQHHHPIAHPPPRGIAPVAQLRIPSPFHAPVARRIRLRLKLSQLVIDPLGIGREPKEFRVTRRFVHMDNLTGRDKPQDGRPVKNTRGVQLRRPALVSINPTHATPALHSALDRAFPCIRVARALDMPV